MPDGGVIELDSAIDQFYVADADWRGDALVAPATPILRLPGSGFIVLLIVGFAAFQFAIHSLKGQVEKALGPNGEVKEIRVSLTGLEVIGVRIHSARVPANADKTKAWPAEDQLRAERILIVPAIRDLFSARVVLLKLRIEGAYISVLRARDGTIHVLPSLLERPEPAGYIGTDMVKAIRQEVLDKIIGTVPVKRLGEPSEIASIIAWLASDEGGYATGAEFNVNGGLHMG